MNRIESQIAKSLFANEPHLVITIDATPLDSILDAALPHQRLAGLVPTLLDWLYNEDERAVVWDRILPNPGQRVNAPVLMCPDDCDFWCTVVIADVARENETVCWHRLGIDMTKRDLPNAIGTVVEWIDDIGPFHFVLSDYQSCISSFTR